jgi:carboxypeptidase family protein/Big-like domain-containing protein
MARHLYERAWIALTLGAVASCGRNTSNPMAHTAPTPAAAVLRITGNGALTAVGQTTQLSAQATFADGSTKDLTLTAHWTSMDDGIATVSPIGLVTAIDLGRTTIHANIDSPAAASAFAVTVLPEGTYILAGRVTTTSDFPLKDVSVEIVDGPMSGRTAITDAVGRYSFKGVTGVHEVRASKDGYVSATTPVSSDTEHVNFGLAPTDYGAVGGVYRLTFDASPSCELPEDARHRTYTATIDQAGAAATVTLTDAQFYTDGYCGPMNRSDARIQGNTLFLSDYGGDCGIVELLPNSRFLSLWGRAEATVADRITGAFTGSVSIAAGPPDGSSSSKPTAICSAMDHQLVFERTTSTRFPSR